jgi:hypothetical protein
MEIILRPQCYRILLIGSEPGGVTRPPYSRAEALFLLSNPQCTRIKIIERYTTYIHKRL